MCAKIIQKKPESFDFYLLTLLIPSCGRAETFQRPQHAFFVPAFGYLKSFSLRFSTHTRLHSESEPNTWRMRNLGGSTSNKLQCNKPQKTKRKKGAESREEREAEGLWKRVQQNNTSIFVGRAISANISLSSRAFSLHLRIGADTIKPCLPLAVACSAHSLLVM